MQLRESNQILRQFSYSSYYVTVHQRIKKGTLNMGRCESEQLDEKARDSYIAEGQDSANELPPKP